jgi:hypothetical protein
MGLWGGFGLPAMQDRLTPEYWRARAEEARTRAEQMIDQYTRDIMLRIAKDYELLARRAEERDHPSLS